MLDNFLSAADAVLAVEYGFNKLRPKGLIYSEYRVLRYLQSKETLKQVAAKRQVSQQAAGKAVKGLVQKGLALHKRHPLGKVGVDRRESAISVTKKGKTALKYADHALQTIILEVKSG